MRIADRISILIRTSVLAFLLNGCHKDANVPVAKNGIIDLREWNFETNGNIKLNGNWKFKWLDDHKSCLDNSYNPESWNVISVPGNWNNSVNSSFGYATYKLKILLPEDNDLGILIRNLRLSYKCYINEKLYMESGSFGRSRESSKPATPGSKLFKIQRTDTLNVTMLISNYYDIFGGLNRPLVIGNISNLNKAENLSQSIDSICIGIFLLTFLYHLALWLQRRQEKTFLIYALICLLIAIRLISIRDYISIFIHIQHALEISLKCEYIVSITCPVLFYLLMWLLYPDEFYRKFIQIAGIMVGILSLFVLITPSYVYTLGFYYFVALVSCIGIIVVISLIRAVYHRRKGANIILVSLLVLAICNMNDILHVSHVIHIQYLTSYGLVFFIAVKSVIFTTRYANAFNTVEHLSENLKEEVRLKTKEIIDQKNLIETINIKLQETERCRSLFFQNISHEFRTLLTLILGTTTLVKEDTFGHVSENIKNQLEVVERNTNKLNFQINQLLELANLDSENVKLNPVSDDIIVALNTIIKPFLPIGTCDNIRFIFMSELDNLQFVFDFNVIRSILCNIFLFIFNNTNKMHEKTCEVYFNKSAEQVHIKITLHNNNTGDDKIFSFDESDRINNHGKVEIISMHDTFGIELFLARTYLELIRGEMDITCKHNKQVIFNITLNSMDRKQLKLNIPLFLRKSKKTPNNSVQAYLNSMVVEKGQACIPVQNSTEEFENKVLIIEDDEDMRLFLSHLLGKKYEIIEADNGEEGYNKAKNLLPDLIISDIIMPKMNGLTLCQKLIENNHTNHIPIILLSALSSDEIAERGFKNGAIIHVTKPFKPIVLENQIKNILESRRNMQKQYMKDILTEPSELETESFDRKFITKVVENIENNISDYTFNVSRLSENLNLSSSQLFRKLKSIIGQSPGEFIKIIRLKRSYQLLKNNSISKYTIAEIALMSGFNDPSYFTKSFKKFYKESPSNVIKK